VSPNDSRRPVRARRGARAERVARRYLRAIGMTVSDQNVRVGYLEIDIVARDGASMVVVEVRCRGPGAWLRSLDTLDRVKRSRLRRAAAILWSRKWRRLPGIERVRFDVVAVDLDGDQAPQVEHIRAAF